MNFTTTLKVSAKELYDALLQSVLGETEKITGTQIEVEDIQNGYKYKRKLKQGKNFIDVTTHIKKPVENKEICLSAVYPDNIYNMTYTMESKGEYLTEITYSQSSTHEKPMGAIQSAMFKSSIKKKFKDAEKYIISVRKENSK